MKNNTTRTNFFTETGCHQLINMAAENLLQIIINCSVNSVHVGLFSSIFYLFCYFENISVTVSLHWRLIQSGKVILVTKSS